MAVNEENWIYVAEVDADAVAAAIRRRRIFVLALVPVLLGIIGLMVVVGLLAGLPLPLPRILLVSLVAAILPVTAAYLVVPQWIKEVNVDIGGDFLVAPRLDSPRHRGMVKYNEIRAVALRLSKGRVLGATIWAKPVAVRTGRIKDPSIVVRAIFERAPEGIQWRRSPWLFRKMSREEVWSVIEAAQVPDVDALLPPSKHYVLADEIFTKDRPEEPLPGKRGWLGHLLSGGTFRSVDLVSPQISTPISRYVNVMLYQMFEKGPKTRVLRRSEPLPALTVESEMLDAPPIEDVLDRLKFMGGLDSRARRTPIESTIHITFEDTRTSTGVPHKVLCQFDDKSDACCQIRLERASE